MEKRFETSYPTEIELFVDRAGRSARAIWSAWWRWDTVRLEEQGGTFQVVDH
jgi:hypothetical protein